MPRAGRRYTAKLKLQVVLEALKGEKTSGQIAKAYGVHANSIGVWRHWFLERGASVFERGEGGSDNARRIAELEQLLGKKEVEWIVTFMRASPRVHSEHHRPPA